MFSATQNRTMDNTCSLLRQQKENFRGIFLQRKCYPKKINHLSIQGISKAESKQTRGKESIFWEMRSNFQTQENNYGSEQGS